MGYRSNDPKKAVIPINAPHDDAEIDFRIVRTADEAVVYSGTAGGPVSDSA